MLLLLHLLLLRLLLLLLVEGEGGGLAQRVSLSPNDAFCVPGDAGGSPGAS